MANELQNFNRLLTAGFLIVLAITLVIFGATIGYTLIPHRTSLVTGVSSEVKPVVLASSIEDVIFFNVPIDWNVFVNGDIEHVNSLSDTSGQQKIAMSVSAAANPITYSDMNWNQVDIFLTEGDLIGNNAPKTTSEETIHEINLENFTGYTVSTFDSSQPESKGNPDGLVYFLRPKTANPTWNVIFRKQSSGDDNLNDGIETLLHSLRFRNYREYIEEINQ